MSRNFEASNNDHLDAGNPPALDLAGDKVTLSAWIRLESTANEGKILAKWADSGSRFQYLLSTDGGDRCLFAIFNGGTKIVTGTTVLAVGVWFHVAGVYDGSDLRVYCNGLEEATTSATGNMPSTTAPVRIGAGSGGSGSEDPFDGDIGHCAIWDDGLSADGVKSLSVGINPLAIRRDSLQAYWPLNGQSPELDVTLNQNMTVTGAIVAEEPPIPNSIVAP